MDQSSLYHQATNVKALLHGYELEVALQAMAYQRDYRNDLGKCSCPNTDEITPEEGCDKHKHVRSPEHGSVWE
jgi:hypothetical protein